MYSMISRAPVRQLLRRDAPTMLAALTVAELFYKWHSFTLEAGGFLVTWFVIDAVVTLVERAVTRAQRTAAT
jgi:hypothetical protein